MNQRKTDHLIFGKKSPFSLSRKILRFELNFPKEIVDLKISTVINYLKTFRVNQNI